MKCYDTIKLLTTKTRNTIIGIPRISSVWNLIALVYSFKFFYKTYSLIQYFVVLYIHS